DDPAAKRQVSGHLLHLLDNILRLLHPFVPFLTEELASMLPGDRGFLIHSPYPEGDEGARDLDAEAEMDRLMETVVSVRTLRNELRVPPRKEAKAVLVSEDDQAAGTLTANAGLLESLAATTLVETVRRENEATAANGQFAVVLVPGGKLLIPLAELIDIEQEKRRLQGVIAKKKQELSRSQEKLGNDKFVEKAPAALVEKEREKLVRNQQDLSELEQQFQRFFGVWKARKA
ncbi:MAG TPA: hypothetical protein ENH44_02020, partial [Actinobacteria bacterium]|nr:hypothetical protein [Actinomycetota bacterium]